MKTTVLPAESRRRVKNRLRHTLSRQLFCERLEDRQMLSTFSVINTLDAGAGSLRQAILNANAHPGADLIDFNIPGSGVHTIQPLSALPTITSPVTIDGYSQPGSSGNTSQSGDNAVINVELDGSVSPTSTSGFVVTSGSSTIRGLA